MRLLSITDKNERGVLQFDLVDILTAVMPYVADSVWTCSGVEAFGRRAEELHRCSEDKVSLDSSTLREIAAGLYQVVDGLFQAYHRDESSPWLIIRAVDSSAYDVETDDERVLSAIRERFENVSDYTGY
jgi:hypothetical protein